MKNTFKFYPDQIQSMHILFIVLLLICSIRSQTGRIPASPKPVFFSLEPIGTHGLEIPQPSGLSIGKNNKTLWMVSDKTGYIYQTDLTGKIIYSLDIGGRDLEGVHFDSAQNILWVVEERAREVLKVDPYKGVLNRFKIDFPGKDNSGFEGICLDSQQQIFVLNEKKPAAIFQLRTDAAFEKLQIFGDAIEDCSGLCSDLQQNQFWIISDQSQLLFLWNRKTGFQKSYTLPIKKAEGVAIDFQRHLVYIVSDSENELYVFNLPD